MASLIQAIAAAAEEQSASAEQIAKNIDVISNVINQGTQGSQQAAAAAAQLSSNAENLQRLVGRFTIDEAAAQTA